MKSNNWIHTPENAIPYMEWGSIKESLRTRWEPLRHSNTAYELHLILDGGCRVEIDEHIYRLLPGQAVLIAPNTFHTCIGVDQPFQRLTVTFMPQVPVLPPRSDHCFFSMPAELDRLCRQILAEYDAHGAFLGQQMLSALFSQLMITVLRLVQPRQDRGASPEETGALQIIDRFFSGPQLHNGSPRLALSQQLHCSERQLNRMMVELYGMTFQEKRTHARMDYAKFLLRTTRTPVSRICGLVGYTSEGAFFTVFKSYCGMTPLKYRRDTQNR